MKPILFIPLTEEGGAIVRVRPHDIQQIIVDPENKNAVEITMKNGDVINCTETMEELTQMFTMLNEILRVLKL